MKFATLKDGTRAVPAGALAPSLIYALQHWDAVAPSLQTLSEALNAGTAVNSFAFDPAACAAPLSGPNATYCPGLRCGAQLAIARANSAGGVGALS